MLDQHNWGKPDDYYKLSNLAFVLRGTCGYSYIIATYAAIVRVRINNHFLYDYHT